MTVPTSQWPVFPAILSFLLSACTAYSSDAPQVMTTPDGVALEYSVRGSGGDTVIVLEGTPGLSSRVLRRALAPLEQGHVLVYYDMRGRGDSALPAGSRSPSLGTDLDDLEALREHLKLSRTALVGHYYGAAVAAFYARRHPGRVTRLALLGPIQARASNSHELALWSTRQPEDLAPYFAARRAGQDSTDPAAFCRAYWLRWFEPLWINEEDVRRYHADDVCAAGTIRPVETGLVRDSLIVNLNREGWEQWLDSLPGVPQPALVIGGSSDPVRRFLFRWWAYSLADGRVLLLDEAEPTFPWVARGGDVNAALRTFLDGEWPAESSRPATEPVPDATKAEQARMPMSASLIDS